MNLLKAMRIKPMLVCILEQAEDESIRRASNRRIDPNTGALYNLEVNPPSDDATSNRLIEALEDRMDVVRKKHEHWNEVLPSIEDAFKNQVTVVSADRPIENMTESLSDSIQNPL